MNRFKSLIAVGALALGLSAVGLAQEAGPQGAKPGVGQGKRPGQGRWGQGMKHRAKIQKEIFAQLNLTADQKKRIAELEKKTEQDLKELQQESNGRQDRRQEFRQVMRAHRDALEKILTPAQAKKYRELMMAKMKEMREKREAEKLKQQPPTKA